MIESSLDTSGDPFTGALVDSRNRSSPIDDFVGEWLHFRCTWSVRYGKRRYTTHRRLLVILLFLHMCWSLPNFNFPIINCEMRPAAVLIFALLHLSGVGIGAAELIGLFGQRLIHSRIRPFIDGSIRSLIHAVD